MNKTTNPPGRYAEEVFRAALPQVLRTEDVARAVGLARRTARLWFQRGHVPARKIAGRWLTTRDEFLAALRSGVRTCADCCRLLPHDAASRRGGLPVCSDCARRIGGGR